LSSDDAPPTPGAGGPVTTTVTRRVRAGHEAAYEEFLEGIIAAASRFPGYLGVEVLRPASPGGDYRTVYRFNDAGHLRRWLDSDEHLAWLERAEPHVLGPIQTQFLTGLETWFTLPTDPGALPPPRYKMALLTWISIFPLIAGVAELLGPQLRDVALVPRLAITTAITVPLMTWIVMPRVTWVLRAWLYPARSGDAP
jgi:antibiotic biosynthesis monooxygenase (ABM) superfamily enzyme